MNRRSFVMSAAATSVLAVPALRTALASTPRVKNVVLAHGLFADGSCWSEVISGLQAAGLNATAVQNPLTTLDEAVAETSRVLKQQTGPTVLVAHSFAGTIISQAGVADNVSALVYIAARGPDAGEDFAALTRQFPQPPATAGIVFDGDIGQLTEKAFLEDFANGIPTAKAKVLYAVQQPFHKALTAAKTTQAAWRTKPSFYAVCTQDRTIHPEFERFMARRMKARTIDIAGGHLSMISHAKEVTDLILEAASV
ncbi:alpha/beta fold hydrolase [Silvibacterium acidisoli]|uniref:alpha/beta fold hydrolase n=1 Tax=Acidobacteriaceae bacterium ZG23-2 TaxID=2883246 RepID=UPI00406CE132